MNLYSQLKYFSSVLNLVVFIFFWLLAKARFTIQQDKNNAHTTVLVISTDTKYLSKATFEGIR